MAKFKRFLPIIVIVTLMLIGYFTGFFRAINFETLRYYHIELREYVNDNPIMTPFLYMGVYAFCAALSIPIALLLSMLGGYLFPQPWCIFYVIIGASTGAIILFLAAKTALRDFLRKKAGPWLAKLEDGFNKNAASYILFLRFVPLFPFWLVNLAPAFFYVRLRTYIWTTIVGVTPGAVILTLAGRGLSSIFETSEEFSLASILTTEVRIALILLAIFALLPIFIKKWWKKKHDRA